MMFHRLRRTAPVMALFAASVLSACSSLDNIGATAEPVAEPVAVTKAPAPAAAPAVAEKPAPKAPSTAEAALADGLKAYQAGQYRQSETQLKAALKAGLVTPADLASAHKHLAFIYCTSKRTSLCAAAFKNAKAADPGFVLTKAEAGHPMWGKTYKKALGIK
jgi:predicted component of type VI protein secretion system